MSEFFKSIFKKPPATLVAMDNLEDARRQYLAHQAAAEYHAKLAEYHQVVIDRLEAYLALKK
jgi:hypothetical protein